MPAPEPGCTASISIEVTGADTAIALRSGDVPVLATPRLVALCEEATVAAAAPALLPHEITVGTRVEIDHLAPSAVGTTVTASAVLDSVERHRLVFRVSAVEDGHTVATGAIVRALVDRDRFLSASRESAD